MILQTYLFDVPSPVGEYLSLIERYRVKGIIKKYKNDYCEDFEWI
jgi:hypothetical protein